MGVCLAKQAKATPKESPTLLNQAPTEGAPVPVESYAVCLDRVRALASNATASSARYHRSGSGETGRVLQDDYEVFPKKVLGEGCNGVVVMAKGRSDGRSYALKKIQKSTVQPKTLRQLTAEVEIYLSVDHPHIAALRGVYESETEVALLTEMCEGGELYAHLSRAGIYSEANAAEATRQMLLAVGYLHAHNVVHRDLKLENFLYESKGESSPLKLIDFGFAKVWDPTTLMMASCGSIAYVSPDVLKGQGYTSKCDLWSLGVIVFMLLAGYPPFHGSEKDMRASIVCGKVDWSHRSRWRSVSQDAIDFVHGLLVKDPAARLDAKDALSHRWLQARQKPVVELPKEALRNLKRFSDASRMKRAVLQLLAQELAPDESKELRQIFLGIDKSGEGTIQLRELKDAIRGSRLGGMSPACADPSPMSAPSPKTPAAKLRRADSCVINQLFEMLDANADEQIYYMDFLAATMDTRSQLRQDAVRAVFRRLDSDDSGTINAGDLERVIGETFDGVHVELLVREADSAGTGEITYQDFVRVLEHSDATPTSRRHADLVEPATLLSSVP